MLAPRIYTNQDLSLNSKIILEKTAFTHLIKVLRLKENSFVTVFNGQGGEYCGQISLPKNSNNKPNGTLEIKLEQFDPINRQAHLKIHLAQAISQSHKMDLVIQKATELGVTEITPIISTRTQGQNSKNLEKKILHWQNVIIAACEQCGLNILPKLNPPQNLTDWVKMNYAGTSIALSLHGDKISCLPKTDSYRLIIGPEGGFTQDEENLFNQNKFSKIKLGERVLRTETAPIVAISALENIF